MEIFSLDLGNKQTKLKSSKRELIIPSRYISKKYTPKDIEKSDRFDLHSFALPNINKEFIWGADIDKLDLDENVIETMMYANRYEKLAYKRLVEFSIGLLATDFDVAKNQVLDVIVSAGLPTEDYNNVNEGEKLLEVLKGQHQVTVDGQVVTVRVNQTHILPQPIGTLYNELYSKNGSLQNESLIEEKLGIVDIGGGTILIDTVMDFKLNQKNRRQFDTGINNLYESISNRINDTRNIEQSVSLYKLEKALRTDNPDDDKIYHLTKHNMIDISSIAQEEIDDFTEELIENIEGTLKNLNSIDEIIFTGGGSNLVNRKMLSQEFANAKFVKNPETANLNGFYKFALSKEKNNK